MADLSWWKSPNYLAAEKALQEEGKKQMERQERQARRERNAALLSDIARVGAQMWAHDGGAWKIERTTPSAIAANSRLQEVRDRNAANMMLYAQRRQEAKRKDDEDVINRHRMQLTLEQQQRENEQAQAKAAAAAQQQRFDNALKLKSADETKRHNEAMEKNQREREARLLKQGQANAAALAARGVRGKKLGFVDGSGKQVSIYENVWKGSMQQVYDAMLQDLAPIDEAERRIWERQMRNLDTPQKKEDYVKQNWHKSPKASQIMLTLSGIDPATMISTLSDDDFSQYEVGEREEDYSLYEIK